MLQIADQEVETMLQLLTLLPLEEISNLMDTHSVSLHGYEPCAVLSHLSPLSVFVLQACPEKFLAQKTLAEQVTRLVHGGRPSSSLTEYTLTTCRGRPSLCTESYTGSVWRPAVTKITDQLV